MGISYLLDTHVLLWWLFNDKKLCSVSRDIIKNPDTQIIVSSASAWEIATKYRIGKMPEAALLLNDYDGVLAKMGFTQLPMATAHALKAGRLAIEHRDPFDRMLMAQAELENLPIITYAPAFYLAHLNVIPKPKSPTS
jgi:PIN domain nuclease of toxin-antitoxin system